MSAVGVHLPRMVLPVLVCLVAGVSFIPPTYAKTQVVLSGKHDKAEINGACDKVGGIKVEGQGTGGYGCYNPKNGVLVACHSGGTCTGYIPRGITKHKTLDSVLGLGSRPLVLDGTSKSLNEGNTSLPKPDDSPVIY